VRLIQQSRKFTEKSAGLIHFGNLNTVLDNRDSATLEDQETTGFRSGGNNDFIGAIFYQRKTGKHRFVWRVIWARIHHHLQLNQIIHAALGLSGVWLSTRHHTDALIIPDAREAFTFAGAVGGELPKTGTWAYHADFPTARPEWR
jgi:hypothetical protein